jgi:hypothetical protein
MALKVSAYSTQATALTAGDLFDLTKLISTGPNVYESQKADINLLEGWNLFGQNFTMPAPRLHNLSNNQFSLTNGRVLFKGSDDIGTDLFTLESLSGNEVFKAVNSGQITIAGAFTLPTADGTTGQALKTNGAGVVSWVDSVEDNIFTADGTIGALRVATLTDKITFDCLDQTDGGVIIDGSGYTGNQDPVFRVLGTGSSVFKIDEKGFISNTEIDDDNLLNLRRTGGTYHLRHEGGNFSAKANDYKFYYPTNINTHLQLEPNRPTLKWVLASNTIHEIMGEFDTNFYMNGFGASQWLTIGASSRVGSEDISLQGSTLVNDKFEVFTTDHGVLLPRVDNAQMAAITADTNEIVFNTDLNGLYRWNGSAWVALSAGYGIVSTTDSAGNPTFYATVKAAYDAGAGSIKLHTDYEETTSNPINIVDGRNIDLNGFTYSYNVADGTSIFEDNAANNSIRITNGRLIRKNGTGGDHVINCNLIQTRIDLINVYAENENGACLNVRTTFNGSGSEFSSNNTSGLGFSFGSGSIVSFGKYVNKNNADSSFLGSELKFVEFVCLGSGKNNIGGNVFNSRFITNTGRAILTSLSATKIYDCYLESPASNALDLRNSSEIYNSTLVSNAAVAVNTVGTTATKMKGCIIQGSHSVYSVNALSRIEDCIIINSGTGSAIDANATTQIINNTIRLEAGTANGINLNTYVNSLVSNNEIFVNDSTAVGIKSINVDIFIVDNDVKGTTTAFDLGTGSNLWTATKDSQGNSAQL